MAPVRHQVVHLGDHLADALTLARPDGNGPGGKGLALFYVELRDERGRLRNIAINRLKDKLGTRKVPTAELTLDGTPATPVRGLDSGVRHIAPMLNVTRTWNAMGAIWGLRRAVALARDYAGRRRAFGAPLAEKPLHVDTLAAMAAEAEGAFHLAFRSDELLGRIEGGSATADEERLFPLLTPIAKLTRPSGGGGGVGGARVVRRGRLRRGHRPAPPAADAQVLPIWEGTTNVLSLDTCARCRARAFEALSLEVERAPRPCATIACRQRARGGVGDRGRGGWLGRSLGDGAEVEAGARRFA